MDVSDRYIILYIYLFICFSYVLVTRPFVILVASLLMYLLDRLYGGIFHN